MSKRDPSAVNNDAGPAVKRRRQEEVLPKGDVNAIKTQMEYYMGDQNLQRDVFFRGEITKDPDGYVLVDLFVKCPKMEKMEATKELVLEASELSDQLEVNPEKTGIRRKDNEPLPEKMQPRPRRNAKQEYLSKVQPYLLHKEGVIVEVSNIPGDVSWQQVKDKVNKLFGPYYKGKVLQNSGKKMHPVNYCGSKDEHGNVHLIMGPIDNDQKIIAQIDKIDVDGVECPFKIVYDKKKAAKFIKSLPRTLAKHLALEIFTGGEVEVAGQTFDTIGHLKQCFRELLDNTEEGAEVNSIANDALLEVLKYHPNPEKWALKGPVTVGKHGKNKEAKSFCALDKDGNKVDFSYLKGIYSKIHKDCDEAIRKIRVTDEPFIPIADLVYEEEGSVTVDSAEGNAEGNAEGDNAEGDNAEEDNAEGDDAEEDDAEEDIAEEENEDSKENHVSVEDKQKLDDVGVVTAETS